MTNTFDTGVFKLLSSPFEGNFLELNERMITLLPGLIMSRLKPGERGPVVNDALEAIATGDHSEAIFRPELGTAGYGATAIWRNDPSPEWMVGQFTIAAYLAGVMSGIDCRFPGKHPVVAAGRVHRAAAFHATGADDVMELYGDGRLLARLHRSPGAGPAIWLEDGDAPPVAIGSLSRAKRTYGDWAATWGTPDPEPRPARDSAFGAQVSDAFTLLEEYVPEYYLWTASILREVIAKGRSNAHTTTSCSYLHNLGAIEVCEPATSLETAEMFVHECSHQHFQLICWSGRMTDIDAPEVYSVLKRTSRPLDRVLLGYHAFANCLYMYSLLKQRGAPVDSRYLDERIRFVRSLVDALYQPLIEQKRWLTPTGLAIYQPLTDRLVGEGIIDDEQAMMAMEHVGEIEAD